MPGKATRIDKAYSWEAPLSAHGLMHLVIANAHAGDPYPVDVLFMYMANMSWNSSMNIPAVLKHLTATDPATGEYRIPKIIYSDAYASEMVAYADLILPDTTYLDPGFTGGRLIGDPVGAYFGSVVTVAEDPLLPGIEPPARTLALRRALMSERPAAALAAALEDSFEFTHLVGVLAVFGDKDARGLLETLEPVISQAVITQSSSPRAMT